MNVPEVVKSLRASCNGVGIAMVKIKTPALCEVSGVTRGSGEAGSVDITSNNVRNVRSGRR